MSTPSLFSEQTLVYRLSPVHVLSKNLGLEVNGSDLHKDNRQ